MQTSSVYAAVRVTALTLENYCILCLSFPCRDVWKYL